MGSLGLLADVLVTATAIKILDKSVKEMRDKSESRESKESKGLGLFD